MGPVEDHGQTEPDESDHEEETPQTAADIASVSLASGALSEVCEVTAAMRELDDRENDLFKDFVSWGCSCDFGPKKTPCSKRFKNIKKSYLTNGPAVRVHGNKGKRPKHHLTLELVKDIVQYILNYTGKEKSIGTCTLTITHIPYL